MGLRRMSGVDAAFFYGETARAPLHVMGALVLESHGRGGREDFARMRAQIARRLPALPVLRRRVVEVPLGLDRPIWVEDPHFDLDAHVRRVALPAPAGMRELSALMAQIAEVPLPRDRPLWEMTVVEGLRGKRFALIAKLHHSAVDGIGAVRLLHGLLDAEPIAREAGPDRDLEEEKEDVPVPVAEPPSASALLADATRSLGVTPLSGARRLWRTGELGASWIASALREGTALPVAPRSPLNRVLSSRRAVALGSVPLADLKAVKSAFAATVNHVILAVCAGALRRYLCALGETPRRPLIAAVPMAGGGRAADGIGNAVSLLRVPLPVHVADPLTRLHLAREASRRAIDAHERGGNRLGEWADLVSPPLLAGAAQAYARLGLADHHPPLYNVLLSNVPGPTEPLYCDGARVTACHPLGPLYGGCALNLTVMSYAGNVGIGAIACPDAVPEIEAIPRAFEASLAQLLRRVESASR